MALHHPIGFDKGRQALPTSKESCGSSSIRSAAFFDCGIKLVVKLDMIFVRLMHQRSDE